VNSKSSVYRKGEDFHLVPFLTIKLLFLLLLGMIPGDEIHGRLLWFATNRHLLLQFNNCFELEQVTPPITATLRWILLLEVLLPRAVTTDCVLNRDDAGNIFSTSILAPISPVSLSTKKTRNKKFDLQSSLASPPPLPPPPQPQFSTSLPPCDYSSNPLRTKLRFLSSESHQKKKLHHFLVTSLLLPQRFFHVPLHHHHHHHHQHQSSIILGEGTTNKLIPILGNTQKPRRPSEPPPSLPKTLTLTLKSLPKFTPEAITTRTYLYGLWDISVDGLWDNAFGTSLYMAFDTSMMIIRGPEEKHPEKITGPPATYRVTIYGIPRGPSFDHIPCLMEYSPGMR